MPFAVGYPVHPRDDGPFVELVADYADDVAEVYFAWPGEPSGRQAATAGDDAERRTLAELAELRRLGVKLDLLFNAACYGPDAAGQALAGRVRRTLDTIAEAVGPVDIVTTTSPAVAHVVQACAPTTDVRASVNMRIGTSHGMSHLADLFDSFYIQRDFNRDPLRLQQLRDWADDNGKYLCLLANSGCLRFCSGQSFHDNLVAHAHQADPAEQIDDFEPLACRRVLRDAGRVEAVLQATWIRPEDLHHVEPFTDVIKLATRTHDSPRLVLDAYVRRRYHGNLLELLEPGYAALLAPLVLDNDAFPPDWFEQISTCNNHCDACDYCRSVLAAVAVTGIA
jgi:collagenase-like PrtC family protease